MKKELYNNIFWFENELIKSCGISRNRFHSLLNQTAFLDTGWQDYYIVSKKFQWIIGFNHHDVVSFVGEGLNLNCINIV